MSIAALKRKTFNGNPRLAPVSGGSGPLGFALNGTLRNHGWVGPTNLGSKSVSIPSGQPDNCCSNENAIIKKSVMNTKGMLNARLHGFPLGNLSNNDRACANCPQNIVQPIDGGNIKIHSAGQHVQRKREQTHLCEEDNTGNQYIQVSQSGGGPIFIKAKYVCKTTKSKCKNEPYIVPWETENCCGPPQVINKPGKGSNPSGLMLSKGCCTKVLPTNKASVKSGAAMSQSEYIKTRYLKRKPDVTTNANNTTVTGKVCHDSNTWSGHIRYNPIKDSTLTKPHFPPNVNNRTCAIKYSNVIDAINAGLYNKVPKSVAAVDLGGT